MTLLARCRAHAHDYYRWDRHPHPVLLRYAMPLFEPWDNIRLFLPGLKRLGCACRARHERPEDVRTNLRKAQVKRDHRNPWAQLSPNGDPAALFPTFPPSRYPPLPIFLLHVLC